jgi:multiple sugar transport system substrate-binding protein
MLNKKRHVVVILVAVMLVSMLAIPAQAQNSTPVISPQACTAPGKLTMWVWDDNWAKIINESIKDWETKYCPGAEVDLQVQPWAQYWDLLKTNAAGGDLPDIFNMSQDQFYF